MPRSSLPTPATLERATLNSYARTTATFFQYATQQSTKLLCYVSCVNSVLSYSRKTTFKMADVRSLEFRKLNFGEMTANGHCNGFTPVHQISSKSHNYLSMT